MAKKGKITLREANQISFVIDNVPGSLARVAEALRDSDINIEGMCYAENHQTTALIQMVVDKVEESRTALAPHVKAFSAQKIISIQMSGDRPGFIALVARTLGDAYINIETIYHASSGRGGEAVIHLKVVNKSYDRAMALAKKLIDF